IIRRPTDGFELPASGMVWVDPRRGVLYKTQLEVTDPQRRVQAVIRVALAAVAGMPIRVTTLMEEEYDQQRCIPTARAYRGELSIGGRWTFGETIRTRANYSSFRRFETSGRLIESPRE